MTQFLELATEVVSAPQRWADADVVTLTPRGWEAAGEQSRSLSIIRRGHLCVECGAEWCSARAWEDCNPARYACPSCGAGRTVVTSNNTEHDNTGWVSAKLIPPVGAEDAVQAARSAERGEWNRYRTGSDRPRPEWVRGKCPSCGDDVVSNCYYVGGAGYRIIWECWGSLSAPATCDYRKAIG